MTVRAGSQLEGAAFERLLGFLDDDRSRAGEEYVRVRGRLVRLFQWRGASLPEELADETMTRVAGKLAQGLEIHSADPYRYFTGVAHLVFLEMIRQQERERKAMTEVRYAPPPAAISPPDEQRLQCLDQCLAALPQEQSGMVVSFHAGERGKRIAARKQLAERLAITPNALRIRVHRLRSRLEACVRACLTGGDETNSTDSAPMGGVMKGNRS